MPTTTTTKGAAIPVRPTPQMRRQLDELSAEGYGNPTEIIRTAIDRMHQQEMRYMYTNTTDNAWVKRVDEIRQMVADVPTAPETADDVDYYIDEVFELTNGAEIQVARQEFTRQYNVKA